MRKSNLIFSLLLLILFSCNKNENVIPSPKEPATNTSQLQTSTTKELTSNTTQLSPTQEFHKSILQTQTALLEMFSMVLKQAMVQPGLYGLQESAAETRGTCPSTNLVDDDGMGSFPKVLTLTFVDDMVAGSTSCDLAGVTYSGKLEITFEEELGSGVIELIVPEEIDADGNVEPGVFTVNGFDFRTDGSIELSYDSGGPDSEEDFVYTFIINDDLTVTNGDIATTIGNQAEGTFSLEYVDSDNPDNPLDYLDNSFTLAINKSQIHCENIAVGPDSEQEFCVITEDPLQLDPQDCACPVDGILRIMEDETAGCEDAFDSNNSSAYDFGDSTCPGGTVEDIDTGDVISLNFCT